MNLERTIAGGGLILLAIIGIGASTFHWLTGCGAESCSTEGFAVSMIVTGLSAGVGIVGVVKLR